MKNNKIEEAASLAYPYKENYSSHAEEAIHKTQQDLKRHCFIEGALAEKASFQVSEYQLCPKCNGEGKVLNGYTSTAVHSVCDVCNGGKTLIKPVFKERPLQLGEAETILNDIHKMLAALPHLPMEKYNPISDKLITVKNLIRGI